jgi:ferredoxin
MTNSATHSSATRTILLCSCEDTMPLDAATVAKGCRNARIVQVRHLCGPELDVYRKHAAGGTVTVACTAQRALFEEVADDTGLEASLAFANVRETAGWSYDAARAAPKMAAMLAMAAIPSQPPSTVTFESSGVALIYGTAAAALEAASALKDRLDITVLISDAGDATPPMAIEYPILRGRIRSVKGHLGAFEIGVDALARPAPSSRRTLVFGPARDGTVSTADILIDLSGGAPLIAAGDLREGYLRADPADPLAVQRLLLRASDLSGTFDKPRYIDFSADLCAHSRSRKIGCTRCLDLCPAGAIAPAGDAVAIDAHICGGCGQCAAACPTGAAAYAVPRVEVLMQQIRAGALAYGEAGGRDGILMLHDRPHGAALLDAAARFSDGLPANVVPLEVNETTQVGLEAIAAAIAYGFRAVRLLTRSTPRHDIAGLTRTLEVANLMLSGLGFGTDAVGLIQTDDPDALIAALREPLAAAPARTAATFVPFGGKRDLMKLVLRELHRIAPAPRARIDLPRGAAFGGLAVDVAGCTLCLSCVSACPTSALGDAADRPLLSFDESLCVQCGLCVATCPEKVIELAPRIDFAAFEAGRATVKEEEPFHCIKCGKPFGVKSTIERITAKLKDKHWMFSGEGQARLDLIRCCDDCRVETMTNSGFDPYAAAPRPNVRTADDYRKERKVAAREAAMRAKIDKGEA